MTAPKHPKRRSDEYPEDHPTVSREEMQGRLRAAVDYAVRTQGTTQEDIAARLGMSTATLERMLGKRPNERPAPAKPGRRQRLAEVCGVPRQFIEEGTAAPATLERILGIRRGPAVHPVQRMDGASLDERLRRIELRLDALDGGEAAGATSLRGDGPPPRGPRYPDGTTSSDQSPNHETPSGDESRPEEGKRGAA